MSTVNWWAIACSVIGSVLILAAVVTVPPLRRRRARPAGAVGVSSVPADDFPTSPMAAVPAAAEPPMPAPRTDRVVLGRDDLLWFKGAVDDEGPIVLGLTPEPGGQLGVLVDVDGEASGVRLDRVEVQGLRDALTCHLVNTARAVQP